MHRFILTIFFSLLSVCAAANGPTVEKLGYKILWQKPHDTRLFTQGLVIRGNDLWESSGLYNQSFIRRYHAVSGETVVEKKLPNEVFAEGLTLFNNQLYLLTWRRGILYLLDPNTLRVTQTKKYRGQGWGITHNDKALITSDGSSFLTFRNPETFKPQHSIQVTEQNTAVNWLNELEFAQQAIWANRWQSNNIYRIDPVNGAVTGVLDLSQLVPEAHKNSRERVLNGIAYDEQQKAFWVTGKNWPIRYFIQITSSQTSTE